MTTGPERELLIESAAGAHREQGPRGEVRSSPAFWDLDGPGRVLAYELARRLRRLEAAADPEGLSTAARNVLAQVRARKR
jgi:hypothetical protein